MTLTENVLRYASIVFAVVYVGIGISVLVRHNDLNQFLNGYSIPFGILFICYGLFRGYRIFQRYF